MIKYSRIGTDFEPDFPAPSTPIHNTDPQLLAAMTNPVLNELALLVMRYGDPVVADPESKHAMDYNVWQAIFRLGTDRMLPANRAIGRALLFQHDGFTVDINMLGEVFMPKPDSHDIERQALGSARVYLGNDYYWPVDPHKGNTMSFSYDFYNDGVVELNGGAKGLASPQQSVETSVDYLWEMLGLDDIGDAPATGEQVYLEVQVGPRQVSALTRIIREYYSAAK